MSSAVVFSSGGQNVDHTHTTQLHFVRSLLVEVYVGIAAAAIATYGVTKVQVWSYLAALSE